MAQEESSWLVLIHQLPPTPAYLRVKVSRRLQAIGALSLKNTVYALPANETTLEDFHWLRREILDAGGEATILESSFIEGSTHAEVVARYNQARSEAYAEIEREARQARASAGKNLEATTSELARLRKKFAALSTLDYLGAPGRASAEDRIAELESEIRKPASPKSAESGVLDKAKFSRRTWVTRAGIFVDRIASGWLIRRYIDPDAKFRFAASRNPKVRKEEVGYDMFEAEFTHEGDLCTFEVLLKRFGIRDKSLCVIAEVIHDLDVKDDRYDRPEVPGVLAAFQGIAALHKKDENRLKAGFAYLDALRLGLGGIQ